MPVFITTIKGVDDVRLGKRNRKKNGNKKEDRVLNEKNKV